jgi:hypothetical protein
VDAIHGARIDAGGVLGLDARLGDDVWHVRLPYRSSLPGLGRLIGSSIPSITHIGDKASPTCVENDSQHPCVQ